jgi:hypothetical protein
VVILNRQQLRLTRRQPLLGLARLTLRAMTIPARVIGNAIRIALVAVQSMAAECIGSAALDGRHDLELF